MRNLLPICFLLIASSPLKAFSQQVSSKKVRVEQITSINGSIPIGLPDDISHEGATGYQFGFVAAIPFSDKWKFEAGLISRHNKFWMDGYFTKENNANVFKPTPSNFNQHTLYLQAIDLPVNIKMFLDSTVSLGLGIEASYYTSAVSRYKVGQSRFEIGDINFKRFQVSPSFLLDFKLRTRRSYLILGGDIQYQVTSFAKNKSFHPLIYGLRFQVPVL